MHPVLVQPVEAHSSPGTRHQPLHPRHGSREADTGRGRCLLACRSRCWGESVVNLSTRRREVRSHQQKPKQPRRRGRSARVRRRGAGITSGNRPRHRRHTDRRPGGVDPPISGALSGTPAPNIAVAARDRPTRPLAEKEAAAAGEPVAVRNRSSPWLRFCSGRAGRWSAPRCSIARQLVVGLRNTSQPPHTTAAITRRQVRPPQASCDTAAAAQGERRRVPAPWPPLRVGERGGAAGPARSQHRTFVVVPPVVVALFGERWNLVGVAGMIGLIRYEVIDVDGVLPSGT